MMKKFLILTSAIVLAVGCGSGAKTESGTGGEAKGETKAGGDVTFASVEPVFTANCAKCHGDGGKAGLDVRSADTINKSGVVVAGKSAESKLVMAIKQEAGAKSMPPGGKLSDEDIAKIVAWVDGGAKP